MKFTAGEDKNDKRNVSGPRNLDNFLEEYLKGNEIIKTGILKIKDKMPVYRKVRGDGNCFFRSVGFLFSEFLLNLEDPQKLR